MKLALVILLAVRTYSERNEMNRLWFLVILNSVLTAWQAYNLMRFMKLVGKRFESPEGASTKGEKP